MAVAAWYAASPQGSSFGTDIGMSLLIVLGGVATAIPLWLFAVAARDLDFDVDGSVDVFDGTADAAGEAGAAL